MAAVRTALFITILYLCAAGQARLALLSAVAFSPDGRFALSASDNGLKIWDMSEWTKAQEARR